MREAQWRGFFCALFEESVDGILTIDRKIDTRIRTSLVRADVDEVFRLLVGRHEIADLVSGLLQIRPDKMRHQTADARKHVDTRIVPARCEIAVEHDVPI